MRHTIANLKKAYVGEFSIPFRPVSDMKVGNTIRGKDASQKAKGCLHEFTLLLGCLQKNVYDNNLCVEQSSEFNKCFQNYTKQNKANKEANKAGLSAYANSYTSQQILMYLKKYKQ